MACAKTQIKCENSQHKAWRKFFISVQNLPRTRMIKAVNSYFNKWPYKLDRDVYGVEEYWASLNQFMKNSGDCEDYAIAKYFTLMALGFRDEEMRIVAVTSSLHKKGHVVLALYEKNDILILDNFSDSIGSHKSFDSYLPLYSTNQSARWLHVPKNENKYSRSHQRQHQN